MQFKCCYTEHFPVSSGHFLPSLKQNMFFFFFYTNWPQMFIAPLYRLSMGKNCIYEADNRYNTVKAINAGCNELNLKQFKRDI